MHQLSLGSNEEKKKVHFVFICDLIKNNVIRSHLMNGFFFQFRQTDSKDSERFFFKQSSYRVQHCIHID